MDSSFFCEECIMNEAAISIITEYIDDVLFNPTKSWPYFYFTKRSYSIWAAKEIIKCIIDRPSSSPAIIIQEFIAKMSIFSVTNEDSKTSNIFTIAKNTAEEILYLFL